MVRMTTTMNMITTFLTLMMMGHRPVAIANHEELKIWESCSGSSLIINQRMIDMGIISDKYVTNQSDRV